jgi:hypothetical protein
MSLAEQAATMDHKQVVALLVSHQKLSTAHMDLATRVAELTRQLEWFKQQMFGEKSERRFVDPDSRQPRWANGDQQKQDKEITIAEHRRRTHPTQSDERPGDDPVRFDESVPVEEIRLPHLRSTMSTRSLARRRCAWRRSPRPTSC